MTNFSPAQSTALSAVNDWFKNGTEDQQVFRLFGYAGTGKSTLAKHFAANIEGSVKFAAYTGKAAHVMAQKGCVGASTIHQLIYRPKGTSKARMNELEIELNSKKAHPEPDFEEIKMLEEALQEERENSGRMNFSLNLESDLRFADLLIIDEVSMLDGRIGKDLESFNVPILVLGDPEQLPPIRGAGYFTAQDPDIMLTDIHRQALDNPIIAMSKMVREGKTLPLGNYGSSKVVAEKLDEDTILDHDVILTGLRKTKRACDNRCRQLQNRVHPLPVAGDVLMCVKNNHIMGLLNGQIWTTVSNAVSTGFDTVSLHLRNPESGEELAVTASEKLFLGQPLDRWEHEQDIQEFEYAYAITVHKSQGSQWDNVLLFDQKDKFPMWNDIDRRRWLYTGLTRAAERITVMRL